MSPPRIVITGMGVVSAAGSTMAGFRESLFAGINGAGPLTRFDPKDSPVRFAAEVRDFDADTKLGHKLARRLGLSLQFGLAAAADALRDAGIEPARSRPERLGVVEGTTLSNNPSAHETELGFARRGMRGVSSMAMVNGYCGGGSGEIAVELGLRGPALTCSTGSASGNDAIGIAMAMIRAGEADVMLAGGAEAPLLPSVWGGFSLHRIMTESAMRPFDRMRDGFLLGEGAGYVVLERLEHALGRGATIYAEALAHGRAAEAYDPVAPEPKGEGVFRAMETALHRAGVHPSEVDYINCHGTATGPNDRVEAMAIRRMFNGFPVAVSATKPVTGHLMAAAGAVETLATTLAVHEGMLPFTPNLSEPDADCILNHVRDVSRPHPVRIALNLSSGFGGRNSCLVLSRFEMASV